MNIQAGEGNLTCDLKSNVSRVFVPVHWKLESGEQAENWVTGKTVTRIE